MWKDLISQARESPTREICGFVLHDDTVVPIKNVARGDRHFLMDPKQQFEFMYEHCQEIRAVYHSHPSGILEPSWPDVLQNPRGLTCIIVTIHGAAEWEIAGDFSMVVLAQPKVMADSLPGLAEACRFRGNQGSAAVQPRHRAASEGHSGQVKHIFQG